MINWLIEKLGPAPKFLKIILTLEVLALILTVGAEFALGLEIGRGFSERGPITYVSFLQLISIGFLLLLVASARHDGSRGILRSPAVVWFIMGVGFLFLAADEKFLIHENLDVWIHNVLGIVETPMTDRIDDILIGMYGIIGLGVLYAFRNELLPFRRHAYRYLVYGFVCLFFTVVLDLVTNGGTILPATLNLWAGGLGEEGLKILAEGFFLVAAFACLVAVRSSQSSAPETSGPVLPPLAGGSGVGVHRQG